MPLNADTPTSSRTSAIAVGLASTVLLGLAAGGIWCMGQVAMAPSTVPAYLAVDGTRGASLSSSTHASQLRISSSGPIWRELTEAQRQILMPLREHWDTMGALTKRRWLVLADRYPQMNDSERAKLASRMNTWASLSVQQRNQARLNFESARRLSAKELQEKWEAYQALSEAEKKRLAEQAQKAKATKKAKRRLAVPQQNVPQEELQPKSRIIMRPQPVLVPKVMPQVQPHPHTEVSSHPVVVPQSMPSVELPPLPAANPTPAPAQDLDTHQPAPLPAQTPVPAQ